MASKRSRAAFEHDDDHHHHPHSTPPHHAPFALYGTPLPAYDPAARDDGAYLPVWKQEVTDERGRKRLHGAFTGGFSAGYFNTVGSKEGWTPSTFVSSRSNRARRGDGGDAGQGEVRGSRIEDFMDAEDLAEREAAQRLETQGAFAGLGSGGGGGAKEGGMFADLFRTTGETVGVKLLQRMGWRPGQGVGPKVRRRAQGDDAKASLHSFAPENSRMVTFTRKTDRKGLGRAGEPTLSTIPNSVDGDDDDSERDARILQPNRGTKVPARPGKLKKKSGIGTGVLNDTGSDDEAGEDPYAMGPTLSYNRVIGAEKKKKMKKGLVGASNANPAAAPTRSIIPGKKTGQTTSTSKTASSHPAAPLKCHDGRAPLAGFHLSLTPLSLTTDTQAATNHPPPAIPPGWTSSRQPPAASNLNPNSPSPAPTTHTPLTRAHLLSEPPLPGKSVFDYLTPTTRDRLAHATRNPALPLGRGERAPAGFEPHPPRARNPLGEDHAVVPALDARTAAAALQRATATAVGGWTPYAEDEGKRRRYLGFLELKAAAVAGTETGAGTDVGPGVEGNAGSRGPPLPARPEGCTTEEWSAELREFAQAAEVFRPVSGLMASRFTTGGSAAGGAKPAAGGGADGSVVGEAKEVEVGEDAERMRRAEAEAAAGDPAEKAAQAGMFGLLTRTRRGFAPTRLLCKRFGVRVPAHAAGAGGGAAEAGGAGGGGDGAPAAAAEGLEASDLAAAGIFGTAAAAAAGGGGGGSGDGTALDAQTRPLDLVSQASLDRMLRDAYFHRARGGSSGGDGGAGGGGGVGGGSGFVSAGTEGGDLQEERAVGTTSSAPAAAAAAAPAPVDVETNSALEGERAGRAVFEAVFGGDSEEED